MAHSELEAIRKVINKSVDAGDDRIVVRAGKLFTGRATGERVLEDQAIVLENGAISSIAPWSGDHAGDGATVIDASSQSVLPGLIETHLHITGEWPHDPHETHLEPFPETRVIRGLLDAWAVYSGGFTTMFSMGHGHPNMVAAIKTMIDKEGFPGPRIFHCGWAISQTAGHGNIREWDYRLVELLKPRSTFVDGPYALRAVVRENVGRGADFIKFYAGEGGFTASSYIGRRLDFTDEEVQAITDEAHRLGFQVSSHCMTIEHVRHAVLNGVDRIEHGPVGYDETFVPLLKEHGSSWCPTLSQLHWGLAERDKRGLSAEMIKKIEDGIAGRCRMIQEALDAGVTVGFGTDNRMRPKAGQNNLEFGIMSEHGIDPLDIVSIGTSLAAKLVKLDQHLGVIEPGKLADLIVVDGDPQSDISAIADPSNVARIIRSQKSVVPAGVRR
jgi:imidazolonepropionase-like amidohydrolase